MYVLSADVGTSKLKVCLFEIGSMLRLIAEAEDGYDIFISRDGGVEQDHEQWWGAMCRATRALIEKSGVDPKDIAGLSICAQMLGLVMVDRDGVLVRRPMNYLDSRAKAEWKRGIGRGASGFRLGRTLRSLLHTRTAPINVCDPLWKYKWIEANEPESFARTYKWLDVKDYLNMRCTGRAAATEDTAFTTMLYENSSKKKNFSARMMKLFGVNAEHMPEVIRSTDTVGYMSARSAQELGLAEGMPVFGGGGDASCIPIGSGYTQVGMTHVYIGTSGWVSTVCDKRPFDIINMIASLYGSEENKFNYHAEMNAAGKCYEWVRDHIALDEINLYSDNPLGANSERDIKAYNHLSQMTANSPIGADGVIFTPWLAGERCPFSSADPCGMFFNISLSTTKFDLIRSVLEGICYHLNWMIEKHGKKLPTSQTLRFVGGGSLSPEVCRILADVTGKTIETIPWPQNAGAVGAAVIAAVGLGAIPSFAEACNFIPIDRTYKPDPHAHELYKRYYKVFKSLYPANKRTFGRLHDIGAKKQ